MASAALRIGAVVAVPVVVTAWMLRGDAAGLTALGAVLLVVGNFAATGWSLDWAGRHGLAMLQGVALGGFLLRLIMYAIGIVLLTPVEAIDGPVLAVSVAVTTIVLLATEVWLLSHRAELWWVHPAAEGRKEQA